MDTRPAQVTTDTGIFRALQGQACPVKDQRRRERRTGVASQNHVVLNALLEISNYVGSELELDAILGKILEVTNRTMGGESCSIYLWNDDRTRLIMRCNLGLDPNLVGKAGFDSGQGIPGWVAQQGQVLALADGRTNPHYEPLPETAVESFRAYICAPLRIIDDIIGVMVLRKSEIHEFADDEITTYETICKQVAIVIEKSQMQNARLEAEKLAAVAVSLSGVAHFIKNLLVSMKGGEYLMESGLKRADWNTIVEGWGVLKRANRKIRDLVENMLNYYRNTTIHPRPVEVNSHVIEVLQTLEDRAVGNKTVLTPELDLSLEWVELDPDAIQDVLMNLISNAIDAIPEGRAGHVIVKTELDRERQKVRIRVKDNGSGIQAEDRQKLFTLFFTTKGKRGTGIGLAATRKLILDHKGKISFESEPGVGTEFLVELPLSQS